MKTIHQSHLSVLSSKLDAASFNNIFNIQICLYCTKAYLSNYTCAFFSAVYDGQLLNGNVYRQHGSAAVSSSVDLFPNADDNYFQIYCQQITAQDTVPHLHGKSINIIFVAITCFTSGYVTLIVCLQMLPNLRVTVTGTLFCWFVQLDLIMKYCDLFMHLVGVFPLFDGTL